MFFVWLHIYAQTAFLFNPQWLLALFNDLLLLNGHFYEAACIIGLLFLLGWLGIRLINRQVEPSDVFRALCLGLCVIIVVIILRTGQASAGVVFHDDALLLLLIPLFLFLSPYSACPGTGCLPKAVTSCGLAREHCCARTRNYRVNWLPQRGFTPHYFIDRWHNQSGIFSQRRACLSSAGSGLLCICRIHCWYRSYLSHSHFLAYISSASVNKVAKITQLSQGTTQRQTSYKPAGDSSYSYTHSNSQHYVTSPIHLTYGRTYSLDVAQATGAQTGKPSKSGCT